MTIASQTSKVSYAGNGNTRVFTVPFYFVQDGDITVVIRAADGTEAVRTPGTDYALAGAGGMEGGGCTMVAAPAEDETLVIFRDPAIVQETDYVENDPFPAETHERALDLLTMIAQRLAERLSRAPLFAEGTAAAGIVMPEPAADTVLCWNAAGTQLVTGPTTGEVASAQTYAADAGDSALAAAGSAASAQAAQTAAEAARDDAQAAVGGVKVSSDDTTPGNLEGKLLAGDGLAASTQNPAGNETRTLAVSLDATPGLEIAAGKLKAKGGTGITLDGNGINVASHALLLASSRIFMHGMMGGM